MKYETTLQRFVLAKPPVIIDFKDGDLFKDNRFLYGLPEAGNHWFHTYHWYHTQELQLCPSLYDPCLLHWQGFMAIISGKENFAGGLECIQTDDTFYNGNYKFFEVENQMKERYDSKEIEVLSHEHEIMFNGAIVRRQRLVNRYPATEAHRQNELTGPIPLYEGKVSLLNLVVLPILLEYSDPVIAHMGFQN